MVLPQPFFLKKRRPAAISPLRDMCPEVRALAPPPPQCALHTPTYVYGGDRRQRREELEDIPIVVVVLLLLLLRRLPPPPPPHSGQLIGENDRGREEEEEEKDKVFSFCLLLQGIVPSRTLD